MEEEEDDEVEADDVEEEHRSQDRETQFVRACAGDMRMDIPQEPFKLPNLFIGTTKSQLQVLKLLSREVWRFLTPWPTQTGTRAK